MQVGAIFGLIFAIIVMAFILIFGTDIFQDMMCVGSNGQVIKAVKDLESVVDQFHRLNQDRVGVGLEFRAAPFHWQCLVHVPPAYILALAVRQND